jgi:uncharacterized protein HemY
MNIQAACRDYLRAAAICPEDEAVQYALTFPDVQKRAEVLPGDPWAYVTLGELALIKKDYTAAANAFDRIQPLVEAIPARDDDQHFLKRTTLGLARAYAALGYRDRAAELLEGVRAKLEKDPDYQKLLGELK